MTYPRIEYDPVADVLAIDLSDLVEDTLVKTLDLDNGGVVIQLGPNETPVSIEVFDASTRYPRAMLKRLVLSGRIKELSHDPPDRRDA